MVEGSVTVWMNGELKEAGDLSFSAFDLGLVGGLGVFETMRADRGRVFEFDRHLVRLREGLSRLGMPDLEDRDWVAVVADLLELNGLSDGSARVRMTILGAEGAAEAPFSPTDTHVLITAVPLRELKGRADVVTTTFTRNADSAIAGVKCVSYADSLVVYNEARRQGADEVLMGNHRGEICEGATSNLFFSIDGQWMTPPLESGCLSGVTRAILLELCEELQIEVKEKAVSMDEVATIEEAFLSSSLRNVQSIQSIDGRPLTTGVVAEALQEALERRIHA